MTNNDRRIDALRNLRLAAEAIRNLGTMAVQREMHNLCADRLIRATELSDLQSEWNGVADHLDQFIETLGGVQETARDDAFDDMLSMSFDGVRRDFDPEPHGSRDTFVPHPTNPQPDYCEACGNALRLDAECRCEGCGNG